MQRNRAITVARAAARWKMAAKVGLRAQAGEEEAGLEQPLIGTGAVCHATTHTHLRCGPTPRSILDTKAYLHARR